MNLTDWSYYCHNESDANNWWNDGKGPYIVATKFALIHSEVSEAFEAYRKNERDKHLPHRTAVEVELADALIRIFDLAGALRLDLNAAVREKVEYNKTRADHKLEARRAETGKKF